MKHINVKVSRACINPPGKDNRSNYNAEWVELAIHEDADLSGCELQHLINPHTKRQAWEAYYRFGANERFPKGTKVRVHSGHPPADVNREPDADHRYHRYVCQPGEQGQWRLNNDGDSVKLLAADGTKIDETPFSGQEGYCDEKGSDGNGKPKQHPGTQYA